MSKKVIIVHFRKTELVCETLLPLQAHLSSGQMVFIVLQLGACVKGQQDYQQARTIISLSHTHSNTLSLSQFRFTLSFLVYLFICQGQCTKNIHLNWWEEILYQIIATWSFPSVVPGQVDIYKKIQVKVQVQTQYNKITGSHSHPHS